MTIQKKTIHDLVQRILPHSGQEKIETPKLSLAYRRCFVEKKLC